MPRASSVLLKVCYAGVVVGILWAGCPGVVSGQALKVGVVTTLEGRVTATRGSAPVALKFKDDVFLQDTIATAEGALARLLLGGKAIVTVRERSVFTVTEMPGRSTVELVSGKIALGVARERMRSGEQIEIRTPSAIVAVRGTALVVDVPDPSPAPAPGAAATGENIYVLRGEVQARMKPVSGAAPRPPVTVSPFQVFSVRGGVASVGSFTPEQVAGIVVGLRASGMQFKEAANRDEAKTMVRLATTALVDALVDPGSAGSKPPAAKPGAGAAGEAAGPPGSGTPLIPEFTLTDIANVSGGVLVSGFRQLAPGERLATFGGVQNRTSSTPFASIDHAVVLQEGADNLFQVQPGAVTSLGGPLAVVKSSSIFAGADFLDVTGSLSGSGAEPFLRLNPSTISVPGSLVHVGSTGELAIASQLVNDFGSSFLIGRDLLEVKGKLVSTTTSPLMQFNASTIQVGTPGAPTALFTLAGPSARATLNGPLAEFLGVGLFADGSAMVQLLAGAQLTSSSPLPFLHFQGGTVELGSDVPGLRLSGASATLAGGLVRLTGFVDVGEGQGEGQGTGDSPVFAMTAASLASGGPLFELIDSQLSFGGSPLGVLSGSTLSTGAAPAFRLVGSTLTGGPLLNLDPTSSLLLGGPLLEAQGSTFASFLDVLPVTLGATVTSTSLTPLIALGNSALSAGASIFNLRGRPGQTTTEVADGVTLTLGTDRPLTHGGPWIDAVGSSVNTEKAVFLDTALLEASAPLIQLKSGSTLGTVLEVLDLSNQTKLTSVGPLFSLNASTLTIGNGAAINLAGTSLLRVTGDLLHLANGSVLQTINGPLIRVSGNSVLNVTGALALFTGTGGNRLNVSNSLCVSTCPTVSGIPVHFTNGASGTNLVIGANPLRNPNLGSLVTSGPSSAAILLDGPNSRVTITAP